MKRPAKKQRARVRARIGVRFLLVLIPALVTPGCKRGPGEAETVILSSAISLRPVMEALEAEYETRYPGRDLVANYGSSGSLRNQIANGAPVDLFLSAHPREIHALEDLGWIDPGRSLPFARNGMLLVFSPAVADHADLSRALNRRATGDPDARPRALDLLRHSQVERIALGEPDTAPVGRYARDILDTYDLWEATAGKRVLAKNAFQVLTYLNQELVDAAFIYASDLRRLTFNPGGLSFAIPEAAHTPIVYRLAPVRDAGRREAVRDAVALLQSPEAAAILATYGFLPPAE